MAVSKNAPLSRADVVSQVATQTSMPATQVDQVIRAFEGSLMSALASGTEVRMLGLGSFKVSERAARKGRNPKTGESIKIAASKNVRFSAGKAFKDAVSGKKGAKKAAPAKAAAAKAAPAKAAAKPAAKAAPAKAAAAKAAPAKAAAKPAAKAAPAKAAAKPAAKAAPKAAPKAAAKGGKKK